MFKGRVALQRELDARKQSAVGKKIKEFQKVDEKLIAIYDKAIEISIGLMGEKDARPSREDRERIMAGIDSEKEKTIQLLMEESPLCDALEDDGHIWKAEEHYDLMAMEFESIFAGRSSGIFSKELLDEYFEIYKEHTRLKTLLARDWLHVHTCNMLLMVEGPEDVWEFFAKTNLEHRWGGMTAADCLSAEHLFQKADEIAKLFIKEIYPEESAEIIAKIAGGAG